MPCGVPGRHAVTSLNEGDELMGTQGSIRQDMIPMDRECSSAAYMGMTVRAKKRRPRVATSCPVSASPRK